MDARNDLRQYPIPLHGLCAMQALMVLGAVTVVPARENWRRGCNQCNSTTIGSPYGQGRSVEQPDKNTCTIVTFFTVNVFRWPSRAPLQFCRAE